MATKLKPLSEAHIERTCSEFLALDGWRCLKTNPVSNRARGAGFGEVGMADCLYIRYQPNERHYTCMDSHVLWIEWKSAAGKPKPHQMDWHVAERARKAITLIAGVDFEASIAGFRAYYAASGLQRRKIT